MDRDDSSPMNSPYLPPNSNSNGPDRNNDDDSTSTRPSGGIPGPLKSPLAAFHPYGSAYQTAAGQQLLAAQATRILAARVANLPGKFIMSSQKSPYDKILIIPCMSMFVILCSSRSIAR